MTAGFALVFGEQMAITPDGRTTTSCAGIWDDDQIEGHARVTAIIARMGAVPAIQLGHTGRKGSELPPHRGTNADRIFIVGGVPALAMMAFGLGDIEPVDILCGAGNRFVAAGFGGTVVVGHFDLGDIGSQSGI